MSDRKIFNQVVYTPLSEALRLLDERRKDPELMAKVEKLLKGDIPEILKQQKCAVLARHIATPNHESRRFIQIAKEYNLYPVFFEYLDDKFTANNPYKHSLGQLQVQKKEPNKHKHTLIEKITIVDFNTHTGKKLRDVQTLWNEPLVSFHRKLFDSQNYKTGDFYFHDGSEWYKNNGGKSKEYYTNFLLLFITNGILFENFLTSQDEEGAFTKEIVLPAIENILNLVGVKPLIIPVGPLEIEADNLWFNLLPKTKELIPNYKND